MIDIGANIGMLSIFARLLHPQMDIFSFEPHPVTFQNLNENVRHMKINTFNFAMGNGEKFYLTKERKMDLCNSFSVKSNVIKEVSHEIESLRIQDIFKKIQIKPEETLLKIDCEGAESFWVGDIEAESILKRTKMITMEAHDKGSVKLKQFIEWFMKTLWGTHVVIIDKRNRKLANLTAIESNYFRKEFDR